jgi:predicted ester cyclase
LIDNRVERSTAMTAVNDEENAIRVARIFEFLDGGGDEALPELIAPRYVEPETHRRGVAGITHLRAILLEAFGAELRVFLRAAIAQGDQVAVRWTVRGHHRAVFKGVAPSELPVELSALSMFRLVDGRVVESWTEMGAPRPRDGEQLERVALSAGRLVTHAGSEYC